MASKFRVQWYQRSGRRTAETARLAAAAESGRGRTGSTAEAAQAAPGLLEAAVEFADAARTEAAAVAATAGARAAAVELPAARSVGRWGSVPAFLEHRRTSGRMG